MIMILHSWTNPKMEMCFDGVTTGPNSWRSAWQLNGIREAGGNTYKNMGYCTRKYHMDRREKLMGKQSVKPF